MEKIVFIPVKIDELQLIIIDCLDACLDAREDEKAKKDMEAIEDKELIADSLQD